MELTIRACEGGFYLAVLDARDVDPADVCSHQGIRYKDNMKFTSLGGVKDHFDAVAPEAVWLVHNVAYDEMIGLTSVESEHRQPLYWYQ